jgi:aminotransferase
MSEKTISVFGSKVGTEELDEIRTSMENQWMGIGPKTKQFEQAFAKRLNLPSFTLVDNGSNALLMAVKILDLPPGSEIILPSFTFVSCAHAIVLCGHTPVFCDVDIRTHNVTRETIGPHLTSKTGAIMVVHYAGKPVRMEGFRDFGVPIIEDAAHAVDSKLGDTYCGNLGDVGVYSFDAVKNLPMPEGGGITVKNLELAEKTKALRCCGIGSTGFENAGAQQDRWWEYNIVDFFPKLLPNDICASVGLAQLKKLDGHQEHRKRIWYTYQKEFETLDWLVRPYGAAKDERHSYFTYCVRVMGGQRNALARHLLDKGIYTTLRYHPLHMNPIYNSRARLPNSEQLNEDALSLPIHPGLSDADVDFVIETVKESL